MGGYFAYNAETGSGLFVDDKEIAVAGGVIGAGVGVMAVWSLIILVLALVIAAPFFALNILDEFVEIFIVNNAVFFVIIGAILTTCKFFLKTSGSILVRILFDAYIVVFVLYVFLYLLGFDIAIYSYFKIIADYSPSGTNSFVELWGVDTVNYATQGHWFYELANNCVVKAVDFAKWCIAAIDNIDGSCFSVSASQINILEVLKTLVLYIGIGGFSIISILAIVVLMFAVVVITIVLPYVMALVILVAINKTIYKISTAKIRRITADEAYEKAVKINKDEMDRILSPSKGCISNQEKFIVFEKAAKAGNPEAQLRCAQCYLHGEGVLENDAKSFYWFRKSALQGQTKSQIMTAFAYYDGFGVRKNKLLAKVWMDVALKNRAYFERNSSNKDFMIKVSKISKKTRFLDWF